MCRSHFSSAITAATKQPDNSIVQRMQCYREEQSPSSTDPPCLRLGTTQPSLRCSSFRSVSGCTLAVLAADRARLESTCWPTATWVCCRCRCLRCPDSHPQSACSECRPRYTYSARCSGWCGSASPSQCSQPPTSSFPSSTTSA